MAKLFPPGYQFSDANGDPVDSGTVNFYENGTTTDKNIFTDVSLSTAATNPAPLDSAGRFNQGDLYGSGTYTVVLKNSAGTQIWSRDDFTTLDAAENKTFYELGATAAGQSHPSIITGHIIETSYLDSNRTLGSGSTFRYTGTTTAGKAGNWPDNDGYFYDTDGKKFAIVFDRFVKVAAFGTNGTAIQSAINAAEDAGRGIVLCEKRTYDVGTKLTIQNSDISLMGQGPGALDATAAHSEAGVTVLEWSGGATPVIEIDDGTNSNILVGNDISNLVIEGSKTATYGIRYLNAQLFKSQDLVIRATTTGGVQVDQSSGTSPQGSGHCAFDNVDIYQRNHSPESDNAHGFVMSNTCTHLYFQRCRAATVDGHGWHVENETDHVTLDNCNHFRADADSGAAINFASTVTDDILSNWRLGGGCAFEGGIQVAAPSGATSNFLPTEGIDLSGIYSFELDGDLADPRMGVIGQGRHLVRGRSFGFRAGLDRLWWGFEPLEGSNMRHLTNDFGNNLLYTANMIFDGRRTDAGADATGSARMGGGTELSTGSSINTTISIRNGANFTNGFQLSSRPAVLWMVEALDTSDLDFHVGMAAAIGTAPDGCYFRVATGTDNKVRAITRASSSSTTTTTALDVTTMGLVTFGVFADATGVTFCYKPNNAERQSWRFLAHHTTNLPTSTDLLNQCLLQNLAASNKRLDVLRYEASEWLPDS